MKEIIAGILFVFASCVLAADIDASWLIDEERYHVSVHGQISCEDCHSDIADKSTHPDPAEVNKLLQDFYRLEQCAACHEDVLDDVNDGSHGGERIADRQAFNFCIGCHDPHYQLSYSDSAANRDLAQPKEKKCSTCHDLQKELPKLSPEDEQCMNCHRYLPPEDSRSTDSVSNLCFHCHAKSAVTKIPGNFARFDISAYNSTVHSEITCTTCHLQAVEFQHANQELADCRGCHLPHAEKVAHDVHIRVSCEACHLNEISVVKALGGGTIQWQINRPPDNISAIHTMVSSSEDVFCRRCHYDGNTIGAAAMILPAKSVMCMPCHAATFSIRDTTSLIALFIFGLGTLGAGSVWFSGRLVGANASGAASRFIKTVSALLSAIFSKRILPIIKALIMDGLLQRRLFRISRSRWLIHALIFFPFLIRFCWGLIALFGSIWLPEWQGVWIMLDKNQPLTAFFFDLSGMLFILGVVLILLRKYVRGSEVKLDGLPTSDWPAHCLMVGIIIVGFILEGMRIAMTGTPEGSQYAFLGYIISWVFQEVNLTGIYGYIWYVHAILTGAFVAYLPFSRMFHMIMAPVSLAINATSRSDREAV